MTNNLKCPYCFHEILLETEITNVYSYTILERIDKEESDGTIGPPKFTISLPKEIPRTRQNSIIICSFCFRRYKWTEVGVRIDPVNKEVVIPNFTSSTFRSSDNIVKEPPIKFVLKERPKEESHVGQSA